ncbi:hypothetical protein HYH02_008660 [Chlamydomonas schloesseri]|uniref:DUF6816 domain-containing protein n=1 Tax=Chlamydomonas schloesseri TaxID=2026947 RepID=A0A836B218_9CHLO|nr:hypothetical protein HYH02_008660 [Chlamydomonas schloesseri]|eukprot:KAG2445192.1 hypothetical protein HYH02_008660 [Chlamydomonas schloesseri]
MQASLCHSHFGLTCPSGGLRRVPPGATAPRRQCYTLGRTACAGSADSECSTSGRDSGAPLRDRLRPEPSSRRSIHSAQPQQPQQRPLARRQLLSAAAAAAAAQLLSPAAPALALPDAFAPIPSSPPTPAPLPSASSFLQPLLPAPAADLLAQLEGRAPIFQPGVAWALRNEDRQLYYPDWLEGEWEVTARFAAASFPQGRKLLGRTVPGVLKGSMTVALPDVGAAMDGEVRYRARFERDPLGGGRVVADRVFNAQQLMDAFYGLAVTRRVEYEPRNPTRMTLVWATPRRETSVISEDLRKAELIINNRLSQVLGPGQVICGELFRQVTQAASQGFVFDYFVINKFTLVSPGGGGAAAAGEGAAAAAAGPAAPAGAPAGLGARVRVLQRVAGFLQPQDAAYFEAGGQAVAAYDYTYDYVRVA